MKLHVRDVMSRPVVIATPGMSVDHVTGLMTLHGIGALPVTDTASRVMGIVTDGDVLRCDGTPNATAADIMTHPAIVVRDDATLAHARRLMTRIRVGHLPVVDGDGRLAGILSRLDALARQPTKTEMRRSVIDRVVDLGGEITTVTMAGDTVLLRVRLGCRSQIPLAKRALHHVTGDGRLQADFDYLVDDEAEPLLRRPPWPATFT